MSETARYILVVPLEFERILRSLKKKADVLRQLNSKIAKILKEPKLGKPLRNVLRNYRRIHIGSYVLLYEINQQEIRLLDFDHHDNIYKKYN